MPLDPFGISGNRLPRTNFSTREAKCMKTLSVFHGKAAGQGRATEHAGR